LTQGTDNPHGMPGAFTPQSFASDAKYYVDPGDNILKLLIRTNFENARVKDFAIRWYHRLKEFNQVEYMDMFLNWLAANPAVDGERIKELTDMKTGRDRNHKNAKGVVIPQYQQPNMGGDQ
jgi:hypothetical protein